MTPELAEGEELLSDRSELWYRQALPSVVEDRGVLNQLAFRLTDSDEGRLSGSREAKQTPQGAFEDRERINPGKTVGTWGVSVGEVNDAGRWCVDDSAIPSPDDSPFPKPKGHSYLDMRGMAKREIRNLRVVLAEHATQRGRLYPVE